MTNTSLALRGIIPPLVTPLKDRDELDIAGLERLVEHVLAGGVSGLFILGTTGEAPSLSYALRRELIQRVCEQVQQRVPVLVGITDTSFVESLALARHAAQHGANAVVLSTPYYFPAGQTELTTYVEHLLAELPLPLVLYNMPGLTKVWFELPTLQKLAQHEQIIGLKDSSGDLDYFRHALTVREQRLDWSFMMGPEHLLADAVALGASGGVSGGANIFPRLFVDCYEAAKDNDAACLSQTQQAIERLQHIYAIGKYASRFIKGTKCALSVRGLCDDFMAEPFHRFRAPERERVRLVLENLLPLLTESQR